MKLRKLLTLASMLCVTIASAQPVLTSAEIRQYSVTGHVINDPSGMSPGNEGANQVWDFHSIVPAASPIYLSSIPVATAPGYENFPLANYCQKVVQTLGTNLYQFYTFSKVTATGIETYGSTDGDGNLNNRYIDTQTYLLPFHYLDSFDNTYQGMYDANPTTSVQTYDAYGTLKTPYGTYTNVFRVKEVNGNNVVTYTWAKINPYLPLLTVRLSAPGSSVSSATVFQDTTPLGIGNGVPENKMAVFPNPADSQLYFQLPEGLKAENIQIFDVNGKIVSETAPADNELNVSALPQGVYFAVVKSEGNEYRAQFIRQ